MSIEQRLGLVLAAAIAALAVGYWAGVRLHRWWQSVKDREAMGAWDDFNDVFRD